MREDSTDCLAGDVIRSSITCCFRFFPARDCSLSRMTLPTARCASLKAPRLSSSFLLIRTSRTSNPDSNEPDLEPSPAGIVQFTAERPLSHCFINELAIREYLSRFAPRRDSAFSAPRASRASAPRPTLPIPLPGRLPRARLSGRKRFRRRTVRHCGDRARGRPARRGPASVSSCGRPARNPRGGLRRRLPATSRTSLALHPSDDPTPLPPRRPGAGLVIRPGRPRPDGPPSAGAAAAGPGRTTRPARWRTGPGTRPGPARPGPAPTPRGPRAPHARVALGVWAAAAAGAGGSGAGGARRAGAGGPVRPRGGGSGKVELRSSCPGKTFGDSSESLPGKTSDDDRSPGRSRRGKTGQESQDFR
jgi:hypothetical protein